MTKPTHQLRLERPPARGTPAWRTLRREQANARRALRERKHPRPQEKTRGGAVRARNSTLHAFSNEPRAVEKRGRYQQAKIEWREERIKKDGYLRCEWHDGQGHRCERKASQYPHHKAKRAGELLYDKRYYMATCEGPTGHHRHMHNNVKESEERGFIIRIRAKH